MGLYTHLCLKTSEQGSGPETSMVASRERKYGCPPGWIVLFRQSGFQVDTCSFVSSLPDALSTLNHRKVSMSVAFGAAWDDHVEGFINWLNHADANLVELDLQDWTDRGSDTVLMSRLSSLPDVFDAPLYTGKTLITRRPKSNPVWQQEIENFRRSVEGAMFE